MTSTHRLPRVVLHIALLAAGLAYALGTACTYTRKLAGNNEPANRAGNSLGGQSPLVLAGQGSFFVGGRTVQSSAPATQIFASWITEGDITVDQMYVQYMLPQSSTRHVPVVMVHGGVLSGKTYETTPDGRMGWSEYFVRKGRAVYVPDQVSRARSGFDLTVFNRVKRGDLPPDSLPDAFMASHELSWELFRFGPKFNEAFPDTKFPVGAADELYKQVIPDLNGLLPAWGDATWRNLSRLAIQLKGAILMGHSESGFFPEQAALVDPTDIRGLISIEPGSCSSTTLTPQEYGTLARIPILLVFGDHLADGPEYVRTFYQAAFEDCRQFIGRINAAGGDVRMLHPPDSGIYGNSHMIMQDTNNLLIADLLLEWVDRHVEGDRGSR